MPNDTEEIELLELTKPIKTKVELLENAVVNNNFNEEIELLELTKTIKIQVDSLQKIADNKEINDISEKDKLIEQTNISQNITNNSNLNEDVNNKKYLNSQILQEHENISVLLEDNDKNSKKNFTYFFASQNTLIIIMILILLSVSSVVFKTISFGKKVTEYEKYIVNIENKINQDIHIYDSKKLDNELLKKSAASKLNQCINENLNVNNLPSGINDVITEIHDFYNQSNNHFAFIYKDIYTGFTVSYNETQNIIAASTIKAPTDIYIYEMASEGKINLNDELTFTPNQFIEGSGSIQNQPMYSKYKTKDLLKYSTIYSDNIAHNILMDNYGRRNMLNFWKNLGATAIFTQDNNWGFINANDAMIYMSELYRFYASNEEYGNELMNNFMKAVPKFITGKNDYIVANKSGWRGTAIHDVSIVFADNPYIVVALSNLGNDDYTNYFEKVNDLAYKLHSKYWEYKMNLCDDIKQY